VKPAGPALALLLALSPALRAEESGTRATASHSASGAVRVSGDSGLVLMDLFLNTVALGMDLAASSPEQLQKFVAGEMDRWGKVVRSNNVKLD